MSQHAPIIALQHKIGKLLILDKLLPGSGQDKCYLPQTCEDLVSPGSANL